jgi:hypothetical protein
MTYEQGHARHCRWGRCRGYDRMPGARGRVARRAVRNGRPRNAGAGNRAHGSRFGHPGGIAGVRRAEADAEVRDAGK